MIAADCQDILVEVHPSEIEHRREIARLCIRAGKSPTTRNISTEQVQRYAELYAYARDWDEGEKVSEEHTRRALAEVEGSVWGYREGYQSPDEAKCARGKGREATSQLHKKAQKARDAVAQLATYYRARVATLNVNLPISFPPEQLDEIAKRLNRLVVMTKLNAPSRQKQTARPTGIEQALIWWHLAVIGYPGKWHDMFALAKVWHLTATKDVVDFKRLVLAICQKKIERKDGVMLIAAPPAPIPPNADH